MLRTLGFTSPDIIKAAASKECYAGCKTLVNPYTCIHMYNVNRCTAD